MQFVSVVMLAELQQLMALALLLARGVTALIVFLLMLFLPRRTYTVFRTGILVGIAGFVAAPILGTLGNSDLVTCVVIVIGYTTFDIVTWTLLAQIALAQGSGPVPAFGSGRFMVHAGVVVGFVAAWAVIHLAGPSDVWHAFSTLVGYLLVVGAMLLLSDNSALWLLVRTTVDPGIAEELCISENTVGTHVQQLYRKLGVHGRQELIDRFS